MNKNHFSFLFPLLSFLFPLLTYTVGASAQSNVTLNLKGIDEGAVITAELASTFKTEKPVAEGKVVNGACQITLPVDEEPRAFAFRLKDCNGFIAKLVTVKGESPRVEATVTKSESDQGTWYSYIDEKVFNSPMHSEYIIRIESHRERLDMEYQAMHRSTNMPDADKNPEFMALQKMFFADVEATYKKVAADNKDTWWGPFSMLSYYAYFTPDQKSDLEQFSPAALNSFYGKCLSDKILPMVMTDRKVDDFDIIDANGKNTPLSKAVKGKKVYLIDFWASWCMPCRKEIPNLKAIYEKFNKKGLEIISLSIDKNPKAWQKALTEEKLPWPNGIDKDGVADRFHVQAIPAIFIVDAATGKILSENTCGEELSEKIETLLAQ